MRVLSFVILLLFCTLSYAQTEEILIQNDWYLNSLTIEGQVFIPPVNSEIPIVELNFIDFKSTVIFESQVCNIGNGVVTIDENNSTLTFVNGIQITLGLCDIEENQEFDGLYFDFYYENSANPFNINLLNIDILGSNEEFFGLEVFSANGDYAFYNNFILSNEDFNHSDYSIYPNPSNKEIFLQTNSETSKYSVDIYDVKGKLILSVNNKYSKEAINVESFTSGIYFVSIKDELGNISVKRIIKK